MAITRLAGFVSFAVRSVALGLTAVTVVSSTALARTPTPTAVPTRTDGPSPTVTRTGSPTATGTPPIGEVRLTVSPNPARSGQLVTLDASANGPLLVYHWSQVGGGPRLQIDGADQAVAHFIVPAVPEVAVATVQLVASVYNSRPAIVQITLLPVDAVAAQVGSGGAVPGTRLPIDVTLRTNGLLVTGVEHEIDFGPYAVVADRGGGIPYCEPGPLLSPTSAIFAFVPAGCPATTSCTGVHASIATADPIPGDGVAYRCMVALSDEVSPPGEGCSHVLRCEPGTATTPSGMPLRILCPDGSDGHATANYLFGELQFVFAADPPAPFVGDAVRVTFSVVGDGGLPRYQLFGADPVFSGVFVATPGGELGTVSFDLQANCPGTAPLSVNVDYETLAGCPGNTYYQFTDQSSPIFPLVVGDSITPTPTPTPPATPTPTCAATGTPYCADQCFPCPTIREGCLAVDCGYCIQNPTCANGEVCDPRNGGPPYGCCNCVTPTPTPCHAADCRVDTEISGLVYDAAIGRQAPITNAEIHYEYLSGGVFPDTSGSVHTGADGRYQFELPLGPSDYVSLTVGAAGFATLESTMASSQLVTGQPWDFGLPPLGGIVQVEPGDMTIQCAGSFTVTITNAGPSGETLVITDISFDFDYGEGVYGEDFTWDISHIRFPLLLGSGEQISFPMSFRAGEFPSRLFLNVISGARDGTPGVVYFGRNDGCATPTPTPIFPCPGDCNGDGRVTVDELLRGVSIALGFSSATCSALDTNADGVVSITELMAAVNRALNGCG